MDRSSPIHRYNALARHCFLNCFHVLLPKLYERHYLHISGLDRCVDAVG